MRKPCRPTRPTPHHPRNPRNHRPRRSRCPVRWTGAVLLALALMTGPGLSAQPAPPATGPASPVAPAPPEAAQATPAPAAAPAPGVAPVAPTPTYDPAFAPPQAPAPVPLGNVGDLSTQPIYKLKAMFWFSPIINGIILGLSVFSLMLFVYFLLTINARAAAPPAFVNEITNLVLVKRYAAAAEACRRSQKVFIAPIVLRCVENAGRSHSVILDMIDSEGRRMADVIWNRISYLSDVSNVAPMFGLLGTVVGMLTAFFGLQRESGTVDASVLSQGVGQSMTTTMFGLVVGISSLVFYSIIKSRATKTLADAEAAVHSIADRIRNADAEDDDDANEPPSKLL